jgi:hypothetical protein
MAKSCWMRIKIYKKINIYIMVKIRVSGDPGSFTNSFFLSAAIASLLTINQPTNDDSAKPE